MKNKSARSDQHRDRGQSVRKIAVAVTGVGLALFSLCSCTSITYDMRKLQQPVVLNDNPFLAPGNGSSLRLTNVDAYDATVSHMTVTSSDGNNTSTSTQVANQAQVNAFNTIAGQRRVIRNVTLKAEH